MKLKANKLLARLSKIQRIKLLDSGIIYGILLLTIYRSKKDNKWN
jgi:hypothetical protein